MVVTMYTLHILTATCLIHLVSSSPADTSYQLVWSDEFTLPDYSPPNSTLWTREVGGGAVIGGNDELEYYTASINNSFIQSDTLIIQSLNQAGMYAGYNFTSGRINTMGKVELYLGYIESRIRVVTMTDGHWPAFWLLGHCNQSYPNCGEIDIMEQVNGPVGNTHGSDKQQCGTLWSNPSGINGAPPAGAYHQAGGCVDVPSNVTQWGDDWHVYAMKWNMTAIDLLVDGSTYSSVPFGTNAGFDCYQTPTDPFYFIINLAEGGQNTGTVPSSSAFPAQMQVDFVRVFQQNDGKSYINAPNAIALSATNSTRNSTGFGSSGSATIASGSALLIAAVALSVAAAV